MKQASLLLTAAMACSLLWAQGAAAEALLIDGFTSTAVPPDDWIRNQNGPFTNMARYDSGALGVPGGWRAVLATNQSVGRTTVAVDEGDLTIGNLNNALGPVTLEYGVSGADSVNGPRTLLDLNYSLTGPSGDGFGFGIDWYVSEYQDLLTITICSGLSLATGLYGATAVWIGLTPGSGSGTTTADFSRFTNYAAVDWDNVDYIGITLLPRANADYSICSVYAHAPEPSSLVLLGLGCLTAGLRRRRRA
jgi:hypothetical protein